MVAQILFPKFRAGDANFNPLSGGKVYTYIAGTSTPKDTFTTSALSVANANPVILDANGYPTTGGIWGTGSYKVVVTDSVGGAISTDDNYDLSPAGVSSAVVQSGSVVWCGTAGGTASAIELTCDPAISAYAAGQMFRFIALATSTGAATVQISGLASPKAITKDGAVAIATNEIKAGSVYTIVYDGTRFQLVNPSVNGQQQLWIPANQITPSASGGCATLATIASAGNQPDIQTLDFDATTQEYAQLSILMPKNWDEGLINAFFVWSHAATATNFGVVWNLQAVACANDDAIAVAFGTAQQVADTGGTTNDIYITDGTPSITVAGSPGANELVFFRCSRVTGDGSDTMTIDARLHGIVLQYSTDSSINN